MLVILCQSYRRAKFEFESFIDVIKPLVNRVNRKELTVELVNGSKYQFMSEQCSEHKLKGLRCNLMYIEGFLKEHNLN